MPKSPSKKSSKGGGSLMDAVTALTSLGDEDDSTASSGGENPDNDEKEEPKETKPDDDDDKKEVKRYIPDYKKPDAAITFPEKLMKLMRTVDEKHKDDEDYCIGWMPDGKSFIIRNTDTFTRQVLPKFFKATKFQSFTRKLYRWGFRQVNRGIGPDDPIIFGNENFQRDDESLMVKMRSVTAACSRKNQDPASSRKRSLEELDEQRKRILFDRFMQERGGLEMGLSGLAPLRPFMPPAGFPPAMMQQAQQAMMQQQAQQQQRFSFPGPNMFLQAPPPQQQQQQQQQQMGGGMDNAGNNKPPTNETDIVHAAIHALRYPGP